MKRLVALAAILVAIMSANAELKLSVAATSEELNRPLFWSQASGEIDRTKNASIRH